MLTIRMVRVGRVNTPVYTLLVADSRAPRNGGFVEKLGQYDPNGAEALKSIKVERLKHWVSHGATLSETVKSLLKKHKIQIKN